MNIRILKIVETNIPAMLKLMREFAEFEHLVQTLEVSENTLHKAMFGENAFVSGLIAFDEEIPIAYAIFFPYFSSFRGQKSVYLEDIYITEKYRKCGIGKRMLKKIAEIGKDFGAVRMDFQVLKWNTPAIEFYKKHGAEMDDLERHFKFTDDAFLKLAG